MIELGPTRSTVCRERLVKSRLEMTPIETMLADTEIAPVGVIEGGILPEKGLLLISGKEKSRKTFLACNLAVGIATGTSFAGFSITKPRSVAVLSAEGGYYSMRDRMKTMYKQVNGNRPKALHVSRQCNIDLTEVQDIARLSQMIETLRPEVLVFDPLIRFHSADENSSAGMTEVMGVLRSLIEEYESSIILVHHTGKAVDNGPRGSSVITAEYDSSISISKGRQTDEIQWLEFETRHTEAPEKRAIRFNPETYWFEEHVQDCVAAFIRRHGAGKSRKEMADALVAEGYYKRQSGAYKAFKKQGFIGSKMTGMLAVGSLDGRKN